MKGLCHFVVSWICPVIPSVAYYKLVDTILVAQEADQQTTDRAKKQRQGIQLLRTHREVVIPEAEGVMYKAGAF